MCGYAVECALKACICKNTKESDFYPSPEKSREAWSHDFLKLIKAAGLGSELASALAADANFNVGWKEVVDWSPESRYETHSQDEAQLLLDRTADPDYGVLAWLKQRW